MPEDTQPNLDPIGVFDSGIGGLTVAAALQDRRLTHITARNRPNGQGGERMEVGVTTRQNPSKS